ncbi:hypothetical protein MKX03_030985 [Papaver bracteatum]|nr:hypothetical protein MKX03_030985 [Papaver bracteatum]
MDYSSPDFKLERDYSKGAVFVSQLYYKNSALSRIVLGPDGKLVGKQWHEEKKEWLISWSPEIYSKCGPFGINNQYSQTCSCIRGFEPKFINEWKDGNWSGGCVRRKDLQYGEILSSKTGDQNSERTMVKKADGFLEMKMWNVPDYFHLSQGLSYIQCHDKCLHNCSCIAYSYTTAPQSGYSDISYTPDIGCMWWTGDLIDTRETSNLLATILYIRVANSELRKSFLSSLFELVFDTTDLCGQLL